MHFTDFGNLLWRETPFLIRTRAFLTSVGQTEVTCKRQLERFFSSTQPDVILRPGEVETDARLQKHSVSLGD